MQRVRTLEELSDANVTGFSLYPSASRGYLLASKLLGYKKVTVDTARQLHDYRYEGIPSIGIHRRKILVPSNKLITLRSRKWGPYTGVQRVVKRYRAARVVYVVDRFVRIKKPGKGLQSTDVPRLNDFQVASFRCYSTSGLVETLNLPKYWTFFSLSGPWAAAGYLDYNIPLWFGLDLKDLSRPLELEPMYAQAALQKALGKVSEPDVDFGEIVGELHQLFSLIRSPFEALGSLLRKFQRYSNADEWILNPRKLGQVETITTKTGEKLVQLEPGSLLRFGTRRKFGRVKITKAAFDKAANRWLEYRYGLMPLIGDVSGTLDKFAEKVRALIVTKVAKASVVSRKQQATWTVTRQPVSGFDVTFRITAMVVDRTTAKVYYRLNVNDHLNSLHDLGLGISNLVPLAHELVPWSFVADWFFGIGDWLRSWNLSPGTTVIGNCISRKRDMRLKIEVIDVVYQGYRQALPQSVCYVHRAELCRRVNQEMPAMPVFYPDFLRWRRVLDSISLLWGRMPSISRR